MTMDKPQEPVAYLSRDGKNSMTVRDFKEHVNDPQWRWVISKYWTDAIPLGPISAAPAPTAAPVVPEGFVPVPIEPTEQMITAGFSAVWFGDKDTSEHELERREMAAHYRAMLSAAPKPDA